MRDVPDQGAQPAQADEGEQNTGKKNGDEQPIQSKLSDCSGYQNDKGSSRTTDLKSAAAQGGNDKATDDLRIKTAHRINTGRNSDGHGEWKRYDGYSKRGNGVAPKGFKAVAFSNERNQLGTIEMSCGRTVGHCAT
jgi:hypothetical protein